jgi:predicted acyltransferase
VAIAMFFIVNMAGIRGSLPYQLGHAEWHGLTFSDTFFPVFLFAMGAVMERSRRAARPLSVARRVGILFGIGVGLQWLRHGEPAITGIFQKIAVAYFLAWLILRLPKRLTLPVAGVMLAAMWAGFLWASPGGVVAGSWEPGTNFAAFIDRAVIGRPATEGFASTLMATVNVLGGVLVARTIAGRDPREAWRRIGLWALGGISLGLIMLALGVPVNKKLWTPSFVVLTHGIACGYLAALWLLTEIAGRRRVVHPLAAFGRNPLLLFAGFTVLHEIIAPMRRWLMDALVPYLPDFAASLVWSSVLGSAAVALALWMDRRRLYVRV